MDTRLLCSPYITKVLGLKGIFYYFLKSFYLIFNFNIIQSFLQQIRIEHQVMKSEQNRHIPALLGPTSQGRGRQRTQADVIHQLLQLFWKRLTKGIILFFTGWQEVLSEEQTGMQWQRWSVRVSRWKSRGSISQAEKKQVLGPWGRDMSSKWAERGLRRESGGRWGQRGHRAALVGCWHFWFNWVKRKATEGFWAEKLHDLTYIK